MEFFYQTLECASRNFGGHFCASKSIALKLTKVVAVEGWPIGVLLSTDYSQKDGRHLKVIE